MRAWSRRARSRGIQTRLGIGPLGGVVVLDRLAELPERVERDAVEVSRLRVLGLVREHASEVVGAALVALGRRLDAEAPAEEPEGFRIGRGLEGAVELRARFVVSAELGERERVVAEEWRGPGLERERLFGELERGGRVTERERHEHADELALEEERVVLERLVDELPRRLEAPAVQDELGAPRGRQGEELRSHEVRERLGAVELVGAVRVLDGDPHVPRAVPEGAAAREGERALGIELDRAVEVLGRERLPLAGRERAARPAAEDEGLRRARSDLEGPARVVEGAREVVLDLRAQPRAREEREQGVLPALDREREGGERGVDLPVELGEPLRGDEAPFLIESARTGPLSH